MSTLLSPATSLPMAARAVAEEACAPEVVLSFDVEEHDRIEAAWGLELGEGYKAHCRQRVGAATRRVLELLARRGARATFFVLGRVAEADPALVADIAAAGHEVASHGHDHLALHRLCPESFRADLRRAKAALEAAGGQRVLGFRAPTFSVTAKTAWAVDVLAEEGYRYDSSVYPVRHDRYGVPGAPRGPFVARGPRRGLLELPPATLRLGPYLAPMGGGGYFRLFGPRLTRWAARQTLAAARPAVATLYFHPWELDPEQGRLPLGWAARLRTYAGTRRAFAALDALLGTADLRFARAVDVAERLSGEMETLVDYDIRGG